MVPRFLKIGLIAGALSACTLATEDVWDQTPRTSNAALDTSQTLDQVLLPTKQSAAVATYYSNLQADLLVQDLLRTDGGGPDSPYTSTMLSRNFERIAFYDEHQIGARLESASGEARRLTRWATPVRLSLEFGSSVMEDKRIADKAFVQGFVVRLSGITGHPMRLSKTRANFHVLVMGEDDRDVMQSRLNALLPNLSFANRAILQNLPRDMHCLIIVNHADGPMPTIQSAVAIVRAEHPDLLRKSCFHEEIAQGMGLMNDSDQARPSIFNDDDEFAYLTSHDEKLLQMLYDPRLNIGMSATEARPIVKEMALALTAESL